MWQKNLDTVRKKKFIWNRSRFTLIEDQFNMLITALNEKALVLEMQIMVDKKNIIIPPEQGKTPVSLLHGDTSEELAFLFPFSTRRI